MILARFQCPIASLLGKNLHCSDSYVCISILMKLSSEISRWDVEDVEPFKVNAQKLGKLR